MRAFTTRRPGGARAIARQAVVRLDTERLYHDETVRVADGEWFWPERGIAIYLSEDPR